MEPNRLSPTTPPPPPTTARWFWGSSLLRYFTVVSHIPFCYQPLVSPFATLDRLTPNSKFGGAPGWDHSPFSTSYYRSSYLSSQSFFIPMQFIIPYSMSVTSGVVCLVHNKSRVGPFVSRRLSGGVAIYLVIYINLTACAAAYDLQHSCSRRQQILL